ncbi:putative reverse transcriptase domain, reverse transcriptase zinc-binding domain protein [Tanacetum coccineum]
MLVWGEADSETSTKKESMKKAFQDMLHGLGGNQENSEDIFSFGSALEDFICVVFVPDRNIVPLPESAFSLENSQPLTCRNNAPDSPKIDAEIAALSPDSRCGGPRGPPEIKKGVLNNNEQASWSDFYNINKKMLSSDVANNMVRAVSDREIRDAIFSMGDDKSSGPDVLLKEFNYTIIALISKVATPMKINDYRPISCCNVLFKCISKIISNCMKECLTSLVSLNQSAFVLGRRISDNILLTQELIRVIRWIMECVTSTSFSLSIHETLHGYFKGKRGLRQGDSMSPCLFTLVMECSKLNITNLCFADDLFLFAHGDVSSARVIMDTLEEFKNAYGLTPSLPKSTAYFCIVLNYVKMDILNVLYYEEDKLPVKHLGVPLI